jgi:hypothetical protein
MTAEVRAALRALPPVGTDRSGPLGPGPLRVRPVGRNYPWPPSRSRLIRPRVTRVATRRLRGASRGTSPMVYPRPGRAGERIAEQNVRSAIRYPTVATFLRPPGLIVTAPATTRARFRMRRAAA